MDCSFIFLWSWAYLCEEKMKKQNSNWNKKQHNRNEVNKSKRDAKRRKLYMEMKQRRIDEKREKKNRYYENKRKNREIRDELKKKVAEGPPVDIEPNEDEWTAQKIAAGDKTAILEE